jgi:hypothetical protein
VALIYARMQGPVEADALAGEAEQMLAAEDVAIDAIDGDLRK